jgi:hypothetical protein
VFASGAYAEVIHAQCLEEIIMRVRSFAVALLVAAGTAAVLSVPADAATPRHITQTVERTAAGLPGTTLTTTVRYRDGYAYCATVTETAAGTTRTLTDSCTSVPRR